MAGLPIEWGDAAPAPIDGEVNQPRLTLVFALSAALLLPVTASAQIYAWRDANGTLVLSDRELNTPTKIYEVPGAPSYRTTTATTSGASGRSVTLL